MSTPRQPPTTSGPPRLSEVARELVLPIGITSTGWPAVRDKLRDLGIRFDRWQDGVGRCILAKREDGLYAAGIGGVVMSIPRQVGKTFMIGAIVFALCMLIPGLTVIWTAHRLKTAAETFRSMQGFARRKAIKPFIESTPQGSGDEAIMFNNGSRILFGARERGFGLGFSEVDILVLDEAQRLTEKAMDDMVPTTNQSKNPLIIMTGTPPRPTDAGEVFARARREALDGESEDTLYIEMGADPKTDPLTWAKGFVDWAQVARANPSFPKRTPRAAILRMLKFLGLASFRREGLGIWDDGSAIALRWSVITQKAWANREIPELVITGEPFFVLDVAPMSTSACIVAAGQTDAGQTQIEITSDGITLDHRDGIDWVVPHLARVGQEITVHIVEGSAAEALIPALREAGVTVELMKRSDYAKACVSLVTRLGTDEIVHIGQRNLTLAAGAGAKRNSDEGLWTWGRMKSTADITPLVAATAAAWLAISAGSGPHIW